MKLSFGIEKVVPKGTGLLGPKKDLMGEDYHAMLVFNSCIFVQVKKILQEL